MGGQYSVRYGIKYYSQIWKGSKSPWRPPARRGAPCAQLRPLAEKTLGTAQYKAPVLYSSTHARLNHPRRDEKKSARQRALWQRTSDTLIARSLVEVINDILHSWYGLWIKLLKRRWVDRDANVARAWVNDKRALQQVVPLL